MLVCTACVTFGTGPTILDHWGTRSNTSVNLFSVWSALPNNQFSILFSRCEQVQDTEEAYISSPILSNMIDLNWSTHDFDPQRTTPPPPPLPHLVRYDSILVVPDSGGSGGFGSASASGNGNGGTSPPTSPLASPTHNNNNPTTATTKNNNDANDEDRVEQRYSEQPYLDGPCVGKQFGVVAVWEFD